MKILRFFTFFVLVVIVILAIANFQYATSDIIFYDTESINGPIIIQPERFHIFMSGIQLFATITGLVLVFVDLFVQKRKQKS